MGGQGRTIPRPQKSLYHAIQQCGLLSSERPQEPGIDAPRGTARGVTFPADPARKIVPTGTGRVFIRNGGLNAQHGSHPTDANDRGA